MAYIKAFFIFAAVVAATMAEEAPREKKAAFYTVPSAVAYSSYAAPSVAYSAPAVAYSAPVASAAAQVVAPVAAVRDNGQWAPGKYEGVTYAHAPAVVAGAYPYATYGSYVY